MHLAASIPELIRDPELHQHVLSHDKHLEQPVEKVKWQGAYQKDKTHNFEFGLSFHHIKLLVPHHVDVWHVLFGVLGVGILLVDEFGNTEHKEEHQWSVVQEVGVTHGPDTNVHEVLTMIVEQDLLGVLLVELGALAYSEDGDDGDDEGKKDGAGDVEKGHGDEKCFEDIFDGVENVD